MLARADSLFSCLEGRCSIHLSYAPLSDSLLILNHFPDSPHSATRQNYSKSAPSWQNRDKTHQLGPSMPESSWPSVCKAARIKATP